MHIRQISIFLENRPGQLAKICHELAAADINIASLTIADTSDFGIVRMILGDHEKAKQVLEANGNAVNVTEVVAVCVPDRPGGMAEVMSALDTNEVNIEYGYAFSFHKGDKAVLVFKFSEVKKAEALLAKAGFVTLSEQEVLEASK